MLPGSIEPLPSWRTAHKPTRQRAKCFPSSLTSHGAQWLRAFSRPARARLDGDVLARSRIEQSHVAPA
jgi:hypothetical protein